MSAPEWDPAMRRQLAAWASQIGVEIKDLDIKSFGPYADLACITPEGEELPLSAYWGTIEEAPFDPPELMVRLSGTNIYLQSLADFHAAFAHMDS